MKKQNHGIEVEPVICKEYGFIAVPKEEEEKYVTFYRYLNKAIAPWCDVALAVYRVNKEVPQDLSTFMKPHIHGAIETYAVIGNLTIEIDIEGEKHRISGEGLPGPSTLIIPPGLKRTRRYLRGTGYVIVILRIPEDPLVTGWADSDWIEPQSNWIPPKIA